MESGKHGIRTVWNEDRNRRRTGTNVKEESLTRGVVSACTCIGQPRRPWGSSLQGH